MKNQVQIISTISLGLLLAFSGCSKKEEVNPVDPNSTSGTGGATIDGKAVSFTSNNATSTSSSDLAIVLSDNAGKTIKLTPSAKTSGSYTVSNTAGRIAANTVIVNFTLNGIVFNGQSGTLTLTVDNGIATGTFNFTAKSTSGNTTQVNNGSFTGITVASVAKPTT
ncbi:MAG: hypothetical protein ACKVOU_06425 [Cytophagales bacterium]